MRRSTIIWLVAASILVVAGMILFAVTLSMNGWNFTNLDTQVYQTETHRITEEFHSILVNTDTADIRFLPSPDGQCRVVCYEAENARHTVRVQDGTLTIRLAADKAWYEYIGIHFETPKVTLYLPEEVYENLSIHADTSDVTISDHLTFDDISIHVSTGDIHLEDITAKSIRLTLSTGDVAARNVLCGQFHCQGSTGDLMLQQVMASDSMVILRSTGDVRFEACDAGEITIHTDTGDVTGTLLTPKEFHVETDTGRVDIPESGSGGKCQIKTDTGDIQVEILE